MTDESLELLQGTLDVLVLKALSGQPMHGYGVSQWIRRQSAAEFLVEDAALYQALHRLERRGAVSSEWGLSASNRRAKYYQLTPDGRGQLGRATTLWHRYVAAVAAVLDAPILDPA